MPVASNPLVELRKAQGMTCYNGYINELHWWKTREEFAARCVAYEMFRHAKTKRQKAISVLAKNAWDWWHNDSKPKRGIK